MAIALAAILCAIGLGFGSVAASAQTTSGYNNAIINQQLEPQPPANPIFTNPIYNTPKVPTPYVAPKPGTLPTPPPVGFDGAKLVMDQQMWSKFAQYLENDATTGFGLFIVTYDGTKFDIFDCPDYACQISPISQQAAIDQCQDTYKPQRCVIFAEGRHIKYAYQVVP